jgi:hypothetical protein
LESAVKRREVSSAVVRTQTMKTALSQKSEVKSTRIRERVADEIIVSLRQSGRDHLFQESVMTLNLTQPEVLRRRQGELEKVLICEFPDRG